MARQTVLESEDYAKLRVLGATRPQIVGIVLLRSGLIGASGALLVLVVAVLASPLMPLGLARQAEVHPGVAVDAAIVIPAAIAIGVLITGCAAIPAWRVSGRSLVRSDETLSARTPRVSTYLLRSPLPPEAALGIRYALRIGPGAERGTRRQRHDRGCARGGGPGGGHSRSAPAWVTSSTARENKGGTGTSWSATPMI